MLLVYFLRLDMSLRLWITFGISITVLLIVFRSSVGFRELVDMLFVAVLSDAFRAAAISRRAD